MGCDRIFMPASDPQRVPRIAFVFSGHTHLQIALEELYEFL